MQEKEQKRLQDEVEKEEKRRENEIKKQLKKQQEEAVRREKEKNEHKKQLALQKQASILERFLKKSKNNSPLQVEQSTVKESATNISLKQKESDLVIQSMDDALSLKHEFDANQLWK